MRFGDRVQSFVSILAPFASEGDPDWWTSSPVVEELERTTVEAIALHFLCSGQRPRAGEGPPVAGAGERPPVTGANAEDNDAAPPASDGFIDEDLPL